MIIDTRSVYHSTRESTSPLRKSDVSRCDSVDGGTRTLSHSFSQSSTSFPPVELTKSSSAEIRLSASVPVSPVPSLQAAKNYKLEYIKANMDLIPDVRGVPMHVGLPLPDDELESLLQLVGIGFSCECRMMSSLVCSQTEYIVKRVSRTQESSPQL